jgi:hypothetical protein
MRLLKRFGINLVTVRNAVYFALIFASISADEAIAQGVVANELRKWHGVTITFDGPSTSESADPSPFLDFRLNVTFTNGSTNIVVPGYYAADGNAAESGATSGNKWRVYFAPPLTGLWNYTASFRTGTDVAVSSSPTAGSATSFDGASGSFNIQATNKTGADFRGKGLLEYVDKRYLQFAETGEYFIKGGADSPENFLAYDGFDQTPNTHSYTPHTGDWNTGDPSWNGTAGRNIIGALNYLASEGMNSVYFLTMNVAGDGNDVWPWTSSTDQERFDCSKLDQWEIVFNHMDKLGIQLHVVTQETENDNDISGGNLGTNRQLYYRELIARFGHHLAVVWNLGEETNRTDSQLKSYSDYFHLVDPYDHPVVVHTHPGDKDDVYDPLLGFANFEGPSLQNSHAGDSHTIALQWINESELAGRPWVVCVDEFGPGVTPNGSGNNHEEVRTEALWPSLLAGAAGCEWYFGQGSTGDIENEDWRNRSDMWAFTRIALDFFQQNLPFTEMVSRDDLINTNDGHCFALAGQVYAVYLLDGDVTNLDLESSTGTFPIQWYDPRNGGPLVSGTVASITGPGPQNIGLPPNQTSEDWVAHIGGTFTDSDGDGVPDSQDVFPYNPLETMDADGDGLGDNFEMTIIDANLGDGIDTLNDVLPFDDFDSDGVNNYIEFLLGLDPTDGSSPAIPTASIVALMILLSMVSVMGVRKLGHRF